MGLAGDIVGGGAIIVSTFIIQYVALLLFSPDAALYSLAEQATVLNGAERADLWYRFAVIWIPMAGYLTGFAWPIVRAYRRSARTAARQAGL